jgi:hypothetical protein
MAFSKYVKQLEIALIEFEYAVADFRHGLTSKLHPAQTSYLERLLSNLAEANRGVQIAIDALASGGWYSGSTK